MAETERPQLLAGLVGPATEALFARLTQRGHIELGGGPDQVEVASPAVTELLDLGLAFRSGDGDGLLRPVDKAVALRLLIEQRQNEAIRTQHRILDAWNKLTTLLPREFGSSSAGMVDGVVPLADFDEVVTRAAELYPSARKHLRGIETGEFPTRPTVDRLLTPPQLATGAKYRMIYEVRYAGTQVGAKIVEESARLGEEVRLRPDVPVKMLHVDDSVALLSTDRTGSTALLIRAPELLVMLASWFDLLWTDPATIAREPTIDPVLNDTQRRVLELLAVEGDEAIARRLRMSSSTVSRHVKAIYAALGVDNRFAAGFAAAKRGWL
ncbi:DNA-binding response regulator [Pseudonocardiaceae bacterium YIM PH 21723]|nr:DNA-binding response regulator [Pseudonocardiaceae bacterium YIM PH 21723]